MNKSILVITGPTAVGKTSLSIKLAKDLDGEIISADSMQIYQGLDVGTAKPTKEEMQDIPHHMIDICHPGQRFSVAQYVKLATNCIEDVFSRGKQPIVVGGTGLYIDNLIYDNDFGDVEIDLKIRQRLMERSKTEGNLILLDELKAIDPDFARGLHVNDSKRIIHGLEFYLSTGKTLSQQIAESRMRPPKYRSLYCVLDCSSRDVLYDRINRRVDIMIEEGLVEEAKMVVESEWYENSTASQAIGYKEFLPYFNGEASLTDCVELLKQHSRNYAKRQLTWFRHKSEAVNYFVDTEEDLKKDIVQRFCES